MEIPEYSIPSYRQTSDLFERIEPVVREVLESKEVYDPDFYFDISNENMYAVWYEDSETWELQLSGPLHQRAEDVSIHIQGRIYRETASPEKAHISPGLVRESKIEGSLHGVYGMLEGLESDQFKPYVW